MTTIHPPDTTAARVSGRTTNNSETSELMRHLLADIPEDDRRHLVEVVDRNHAEQLARKRRARLEADTDLVVEPDDTADDY